MSRFIRPAARALALSALALATSLGAAATASAQTVFYACYVPASGTVYRIKAANTPQNCLQPTHVAFNWTDGASALASLQDAVKMTDVAAGDVTGVFTNLTVGKLLGRALATTPPTDGQVLTWNATTSKWEPKTVASGGGGVTDHSQLTGVEQDDHPQYMLTEGIRSSNGFAVTGVPSNFGPMVSGPGRRLMWYPGKAAFRVGEAATTEWDSPKIGAFSTVLGFGTASGASSFATGGGVASGVSAFAANQGTASGDNSLSWGSSSTASGSGAIAMGINATAAGLTSVAIGPLANAYGERSMAFGYRANASAESAVAMGPDATASGIRSVAIGVGANTNNKGGSVVINTSGGTGTLGVESRYDGQFAVRASHFWFGNSRFADKTVGRYLETGTGAYLSDGGTWTNVSDSTKKTAFLPLDGEATLQKLAALPVYSWQYKAESKETRHVGPTAQAFHAAFGLGDTNTAISTVDIDGITMAGVKALEQRTKALKAETNALRAENAELSARVSQLEAAVAQLLAAARR